MKEERDAGVTPTGSDEGLEKIKQYQPKPEREMERAKQRETSHRDDRGLNCPQGLPGSEKEALQSHKGKAGCQTLALERGSGKGTTGEEKVRRHSVERTAQGNSPLLRLIACKGKWRLGPILALLT